MSDNEKNEEDNGQDEGSINVFEDNAYMFGDDPSGNNLEEQNEINDENQNSTKEKENKDEYGNNENEEINNLESKDSLRKYLEQQMKHEQMQNNNDNIDINKNSINNKLSTNEENISKKIQNSKGENDINISKKSEKKLEKELINNNNNNNLNDEYEGEEQEQGEEYVGEEEEIENGEVEDIEGEVEGEGEEENIPLVTLKFISICQFCKNNFDSTIHLPYLLKCGHFFCLKCIKENFTDEEGIKCPNDGLVALSVKELKLLNNLITDKSIPSQRDNLNNKDNLDNINNMNINGIDNNKNNEKIDTINTCKIHKGQKLTHIITETKQLVCVYCAFDVVRKNPKCEVKEIKEKFDELILDAEKIINLNQNNIKIIQDSLKDIKKNKETEEKSINLYFDHIFKYLNSKKAEYLSQIDSLFTDNAKQLKQKLEIFSEQIEQGESLKALIDNYENNNNFDEIMETFVKLENIKKSEKDNNLINLQEYKFSHDDETKIMKYINNFGDIKTINKYVHFQNDKKDIFNLKVSSNVAPLVEEQKKNFFNFNTNPALINNNANNLINNKNSSRLTNNSTENQDMENEMNYNNNSNISGNNNNKKQGNLNNYNFNFNKINPMSNNTTGKRGIKTNFGNNNFFRHLISNNEYNNGNMNYINMDSNNRDNKNYSFNNLSNNNKRGNRIISIQENNYLSNKGTSGEGRLLNNNIYNINYSKRDKDNLNKNMNNKNIRNDFGKVHMNIKDLKLLILNNNQKIILILLILLYN